MSEQNYKDVCLLDSNNYFLRQIRVFRNPRDPENFIYPENTYEIEPPSEIKILQGNMARWNNEESVWEYIQMEPTPLDEHDHSQREPIDVMDVLRVSRDIKLHMSDVHILKCYENGEPVSEEVKKYRSELRDIPNKIADGTYEKPKENPKPDPIKRFRDPSTLILFEHWPQIPKEMQ